MFYTHAPKRGIHTIRDFRVGIQTYGDTEDTNKFNIINNLEVDKPGMLYKRNTQYRKTSTDTLIFDAKKWWKMAAVQGHREARANLATTGTVKY